MSTVRARRVVVPGAVLEDAVVELRQGSALIDVALVTQAHADRSDRARSGTRMTAAPPHPPVPTAARPPGGLMDAQEIVAGLGGADIRESRPHADTIASDFEDLLG